MSVLHGLLLAPTVEYKNYTQLMWIGNLVSVVVALAVFFVFFFIFPGKILKYAQKALLKAHADE